MKRWMMILAAFLGVLCAWAGAQAQGSSSGRSMTVLVYMCGSNLESTGGSASADIQEMLAATAGNDDICLLVMTGGTRSDNGDFSSRNTRIVEINKGRKRTLLDEDLMNMGSGESLAWFMDYGMENRPAEQYALILWNHGGGPLEGVCWDEMFSMDHLSLGELTDALMNAHLEKPLAWIGFDACLMSSMEVASAVAPYADYMIASQETEPAFGWNYAFLSDISREESGAETGRRIVDAFFEGYEDSRETMTLACTDLGRIRMASEALGAYFSTLTGTMSEDDYIRFAESRNQAVGFGDAVKGFGNPAAGEPEDNGYDLVDALDLLRRMGEPDDSAVQNAIGQLEKAVVYSRSNREGAGGLSLYFPYYNKDKYLDSWRASYETLGFDWYYRQYIQSFATVLSGERMVEWKHLIPEYRGKTSDGEHVIALPLTEEQREHLASAQLLILSPHAFGNLNDSCGLVGVCHAEIGADNCLTAAYDNRLLYVELEDGTRKGPVSFSQTRDGQYNVAHMVYQTIEEIEIEPDPNAVGFSPTVDFVFHLGYVLHFLDAGDRSSEPEIQKIQVWDEATQTFTSRISFSPDDYETMMPWDMIWKMPRDSEGVLPPLNDWPLHENLMNLEELRLPCNWHYTFSADHMDGDQLYAVFQITDIQQNRYCSLPVAIENPDRTAFRMVSDPWRSELEQATLTGAVVRSKEWSGVELILDMENLDSSENTYQISEIELNGNRYVPGRVGLLGMDIPEGGHHSIRLQITPQDLAGMDEIRSVAVSFTENSNKENEREDTARFEIEGCDVSDLAPQPLAVSEQGDIRISLLSVEPGGDGTVQIAALMENGSDETCCIENIAVNQISTDAYYSEKVEPGHSRVLRLKWENRIRLRNDNFPVRGITDLDRNGTILLEGGLLQTSEDLLIRSIAVSCYLGDSRLASSGKHNVVLTLPTPLDPPEAPAEPEVTAPVLLAQNNEYTLKLRRIVAGDQGVALVMDLTNLTDHFIDVEIQASVPGAESRHDDYEVQPQSTMVICRILDEYKGLVTDQAVQTIEVQPASLDQPSAVPAVIELAEPVRMGENGGVWIAPENVRVAPATEPDAEWRAPQGLENTVLLPENAAGFTRWLEVPLTPEEMAVSKGGNATVLKEWEDGKWQIVSIQKQVRNEEGRLGCFHPGLVLCPDGLYGWRDMLLLMVIDKQETDALQLSSLSWSVQGGSSIAKMESYEDILIDVDYLQNTAALSFTAKDVTEPFERMSEIRTFHAPLLSRTQVTGNDGRLKPLADWEGKALNMYIDLDDPPVQLVFRPITPEDNLWVAFDILGPDGEPYCLMMPWPAE